MLFLMATISAGACSDSEPNVAPAEAANQGSAVPVVREEADLRLPLDDYDLDAAGRSTVQTARYALIAECLARFGFDMPEHDTSPARYPANADYLGWLGALDVSVNGYTGTEDQVLRHRLPARDGIRGYPIPAEQDAVHIGSVRTFKGKQVPPEGCDGEAQRKLNGQAPGPDGKVPARPHIYKDLYVLMDDAAEAAVSSDGSRVDQRIAESTARWSSCMKAKGFGYGRPSDAEHDPRWAGRREVPDGKHLAPPTKEELETATADEQCRLQVNYSGARKAAWSEAQRNIIAARTEQLERLRNLQQTRYRNALKVLGENPS
ncbi:hypothetical protein [Nonomuraea rubra]|uniref:Uncharacterized protein n=1 Tax=Nonomuraea rubra TaxID=46180 RepID=A0A7X0NMH6_9ACTN|nr:hypothetical protein [Nonomuraea rubra]MBB6546140.1 hypothetical protein [Nonomuraea rubra]